MFWLAGWRHQPKIGSKRVQTCILCTNSDRKMKANSKGKLEVRFLFLKSLFQNFWLPVVTSSTKKSVKKIPIGISCTYIDTKMKIKSKRIFEVKYSFIKTFSRNFEVLAQRSDVMNPILARKMTQTRISCTIGDREM